jgi:hypothetical protein
MLFREILLYPELEMVGDQLDEGILSEDGVMILNHFQRSRTVAPLIYRTSVNLDYFIYNTICPKQNSRL